MSSRPLREALSIIADEGFTIDSVRSSKHVVIHATHANGAQGMFTLSRSPSDHRSILNFRAQVRRAAKQGEMA